MFPNGNRSTLVKMSDNNAPGVPPLQVAFPPPAPDPNRPPIRCTFCNRIFNEAQQLHIHTLTTHRSESVTVQSGHTVGGGRPVLSFRDFLARHNNNNDASQGQDHGFQVPVNNFHANNGRAHLNAVLAQFKDVIAKHNDLQAQLHDIQAQHDANVARNIVGQSQDNDDAGANAADGAEAIQHAHYRATLNQHRAALRDLIANEQRYNMDLRAKLSQEKQSNDQMLQILHGHVPGNYAPVAHYVPRVIVHENPTQQIAPETQVIAEMRVQITALRAELAREQRTTNDLYIQLAREETLGHRFRGMIRRQSEATQRTTHTQVQLAQANTVLRQQLNQARAQVQGANQRSEYLEGVPAQYRQLRRGGA
ncbi:hypothetical protein GE09DRAFT_1113192 [Coniochaeta sp. 2T2.1]|nr:hypothetical protein GE09DRAFT_1113192 [Coniochaeta sp. 2T2.1]